MMKSLLCFVSLMVLLLVPDSTTAPGPRPQFGISGGIDLLDFVSFIPAAEKKGSKIIEQTPIIKNSTTIGGYINGHKGDKNGAQSNNSIQVKQMPDN